MYTKHSQLVRLVGIVVLILSVAAGTASASVGNTPQGLKADGLRLQAMADQYLKNQPAASFYSPQALKADGLRWQAMADHYLRLQNRPAASFYTPQALKAEGLRWQAMAQAYEGQQPAVASSSRPAGFDWGDAGIGAAGGLGVALMGVGLALVARRTRRARLVV